MQIYQTLTSVGDPKETESYNMSKEYFKSKWRSEKNLEKEDNLQASKLEELSRLDSNTNKAEVRFFQLKQPPVQ